VRSLAVVALASAISLQAVPATAAPRELTIGSSAPRVTYGDPVTLSGTVWGPSGTASTCLSNVEVILRSRGPTDVHPPPPPSSWPELARVMTDANGAFTYTFEPDSNAYYAAEVQENAEGCDPAVSSEITIGVRVLVTIRSRDLVVEPGEQVRFTVRARPHCSGFEPEVRLERKRGSKVTLVDQAEPRDPDRCVARFAVSPRTTGVYRGSAGPVCHIVCPYHAGESKSLRVRTARK
jgi:hypothetical protein